MHTKTYTDSTNIKTISHEGTTMAVEFIKSGWYEYYNVPLSLYNQATQADSIGQWVIKNLVKGNFKWRKI